MSDAAVKLNGRRVVASVSGGKDSGALSLWLTEQGIDHDRVFCDTGWERESTLEYVRDVLPRHLGPITWLRAEKQMTEMVREKGMFPSRLRRFCTVELKVKPIQKHINALVARGMDLVNAVGIRAAESKARAELTEWEWSEGFDCEVWRPLIAWTEDDVIAIHKRHGLPPNPLYLLGAKRVGCWPCIQSSKVELRVLAMNDPQRLVQIGALEREVTASAQARADAAGVPLKHARTFFQAPRGRKGTWPIERVAAWSLTAHGASVDQGELFAPTGDDAGCMRWGLCDTGSETT